MIITFTNVIGAIRTAFSVVRSGLKMWLGFETSSIDGDSQITPDKSGNNNVGELFTGKAIELDGFNDEINFGTTQIPVKTISFWIKPLSVSNEGLFYLGLSGFPQFKQISITSGNISATSYLTNFTTYVNNIQTSAVTQDVWQRVVLTFDEWTTTSLQIGKVYSSVYGHFAISDVQFYNETWSTDDIAYDYANPQNLVTDRIGTSIGLSNLKGYWALSEGAGSLAYDSSGEGNNGTIIGATYEPAQPRIPQLGMQNFSNGAVAAGVTLIADPNNPTLDIDGNAVRDRLNSFNLDGSGYAKVADEDSINPTTEITIQCWIQSNTETDKGLVAKWISTTKDYMLYKRTNNFTLYIGTTPLQSGTLPSSGWVNIAGTYNGSTMKTFINGVESTTQAQTGAIPNNDNVLEIGRYAENNIYSYSERISDVLLYDTALDADEIENNYNAGLSAHTN